MTRAVKSDISTGEVTARAADKSADVLHDTAAGTGEVWVAQTPGVKPIPAAGEVVTAGEGRLKPWPYQPGVTVYEAHTYTVEAAPFLPLNRATFMLAMVIDLGVSKAQVQAVVDGMPEGTAQQQAEKAAAQIQFDDAQQFERDNDLVNSIASVLALSDADIDAAWRVAPDKYGS